jgi:uncharacterized protein
LTIVISPRCRCLVARLSLALLMVFASGCETPPATPQPGEYTTQESRIQLAEDYLAQSVALESPQRDERRLQAAELFADNNKPLRAYRAIKGIRAEALSDDALGHYGLLAGNLALDRKDYDFAKQVLLSDRLQKRATRFDPQQMQHWLMLNGELQHAEGNAHKSLYFFTRASTLTDDPDILAELNTRVWRNLNRQSRQDLERNSTLSSDPIVVGWYELARATRSTQSDLTRQIVAIEQWRSRHTGHPAARVLPDSLKAVVNIERSVPRHIALLLPTVENYRLAADTVLQGVMAAYYQALNENSAVPVIRVYDTDSGNIASIYQRAVANGAELVIGPLRKEKVAELMAAPHLAVPVLALNFVDDKPNLHDNLFQFGLSVEDEALQVAEYAWQQGHRAAMVITPDTSWGQSSQSRFTRYWQEQGGHITASTTYNVQQMDYAELLEPAFLLHHSRQRAQRLEKALGKKIAANPGRRRDLDMIFMVANAQSGQQIKPSLDYLYAGDLPVYATSMINDGKSNKSINRDLNDIMFTAMPWSVEAFSRGNLKPSANLSGAYRNLFALGVDAYGIHQWLSVLKAMPGADIRGQTGELKMESDNHIVRTLPWARFVNGKAVPLTMIRTEH